MNLIPWWLRHETIRYVLSNRRMRHITMHLLAIAMAAAVMGAAGTASVRPIPNPHVSDTTACLCSSQIVVPQNTIFSPTQLQPDTFLAMETVKVGEASVPIYQFKQPERLSSLQLPFKIVLQKNLPTNDDLYELEVGQEGLDSWFIGYKWSVLVCSSDCNGRNTHIGWHFKPVNSGEKGFYALIVKTDKEGNGIFSGISLEAFREFIQVGVPAPAWMLTLLATQSPKNGL